MTGGAYFTCSAARSLLCVTAVLLAVPAAAQGNLSTQGFGYPAGALSTRALGTGGGIGENDPQSSLNPVAPLLWGAPVLFGQYDPEFRRVSTNAGSSRTMTARFPGFGASFPLGVRWAAGLNVSTYLDRTWSTQTEGTQVVGVDTVTVTHRFASDGAINDVRLAVAYGVTPRVSIGIGGHRFTGENRITVQQEFPDTVRFTGLLEESDISYSGSAVSFGIEVRPGRFWHMAASVRQGGDITAESGDTTLSSARIPLRYGAGITYSGLQGAVFAARAGFEEWSSLQELGSAQLTAFDAWDVGAGAEVTGPRVGGRVMLLRAGARHRTLPFGAGGSRVKERSFSGGFGLPIAMDRAMIDLAFVRAAREAESGSASDVNEVGYILSVGIRVRP